MSVRIVESAEKIEGARLRRPAPGRGENWFYQKINTDRYFTGFIRSCVQVDTPRALEQSGGMLPPPQRHTEPRSGEGGVGGAAPRAFKKHF
jgi:hypothetical protein